MNEAIEFAEWINDKGYVRLPNGNWWSSEWRVNEHTEGIITSELYNLFNPSGAAPQPPTEGQEPLCELCQGDGFIQTDNRQEDGTYQIDCPYCEARNDAMEETDLYPAAQPAGPVNHEAMVKALEQVRDYSTGKLGSKYLGCIIADCKTALENYYKIESAIPQQVFTREQVSRAYADGAIAEQSRKARKPYYTEDEYMNTNYPIK